MAYIESSYNIVLTNAGGTISLPTSQPYGEYDISGSATMLASYNITYSGTLSTDLKYVLNYDATMTLNGNTLTVFGLSLDSVQALQKGVISAKYDGSSWNTVFLPDFENSNIIEAKHLVADSVTTAKILDDNVTNAKLADMATMTVKANVTGGSANPTDVAIGTLVGLSGWKTTGNSGTTAGTNFIGTTDNIDLVLKVNNTESGRLDVSDANTSYGMYSLDSNTTGSNNTAVGNSALTANTSGYSNVAIGRDAMVNNISGIDNTAVGDSALAVSTTSNNNTAIGFQSLSGNVSTDNNTAIGYQALVLNTTGGQNTAVGASSLSTNTSGDNNTAVGYISLEKTTNGEENTAVGYSSLNSNTTGDYNTAIGSVALSNGTSGSNNTCVGYVSGSLITTGSNNTIIGAQADVDSVSSSNRIAIGSGATATADYQFAIPSGITTVKMSAATITSEGLAITSKSINTTAGDSATINATAGRFRKDTSGTTFTLTNSYITADSIIMLQVATVGLTAGFDLAVVAGSGSAVITFQTAGVAAAPSANADINFWVIN